MTTLDTTQALVRWAEWSLPGLAEWSLPGEAYVAYEALERRAKSLRGKRLTNKEFGELLKLTRAERDAFRITRRFVTECDLTPEMKRQETLDRKERRRKGQEKRRRSKGIKPRQKARWRFSNSSKSAYYRKKKREIM